MIIFKKTKRTDLRYRIVQSNELSHKRKTTGLISEMIKRKREKAFSKVHLYMLIQTRKIFIKI